MSNSAEISWTPDMADGYVFDTLDARGVGTALLLQHRDEPGMFELVHLAPTRPGLGPLLNLFDVTFAASRDHGIKRVEAAVTDSAWAWGFASSAIKGTVELQLCGDKITEAVPHEAGITLFSLVTDFEGALAKLFPTEHQHSLKGRAVRLGVDL